MGIVVVFSAFLFSSPPASADDRNAPRWPPAFCHRNSSLTERLHHYTTTATLLAGVAIAVGTCPLGASLIETTIVRNCFVQLVALQYTMRWRGQSTSSTLVRRANFHSDLSFGT